MLFRSGGGCGGSPPAFTVPYYPLAPGCGAVPADASPTTPTQPPTVDPLPPTGTVAKHVTEGNPSRSGVANPHVSSKVASGGLHSLARRAFLPQFCRQLLTNAGGASTPSSAQARECVRWSRVDAMLWSSPSRMHTYTLTPVLCNPHLPSPSHHTGPFTLPP